MVSEVGTLPAAYSEDEFIPISALQHYLYCPRQCALIHLEQAWAENVLTAEGRQLHARADQSRAESRGELRQVSGLALKSARLGLTGRADVVEFHREGPRWRPFPVEYKRGRPKKNLEDKVQLCAQAFCLEEMLSLEVPDGALYYGQSRRRQPVLFDQRLRQATVEACRVVHELLRGETTPRPVNDRRCVNCSLAELCRPSLAECASVAGYLGQLRRSP
jgi:CRISPR-associated exonuclease Cas4